MAADFCRPMLSVGARKSDRAAHAGPIQFVEADALRLPFADAMFQIVSVAFGLRNVGETDRALEEMARVCRDGGKVVVLEFSMPSARPMRALYRWYFHQVLPRIGQTLARNADDAYRYLPESVEQFPQGEELARRMRAVGLTQVSHHPLTFGVATLYVGTK